ncbi:MAG TPA: hypothetical protein VKT80_01525, partial [Chloroflexota bacterium]|nr:hypothetical protein [Chloroflexota bacterium]
AGDADVVLSQITQIGTNYPLNYQIYIYSGETIAIRSLTVAANDLDVEGNLSISNSLVVTTGGYGQFNGTLSAGSIQVSSAGQIDAHGPIVCVGALTNQGSIGGDVVNNVPNSVSISCGSIQNSGVLYASNGATVTVSVTQPGGFTNFSGTTLTAGTYEVVAASTLDLQLGGSVATLAATLEFVGARGVIAAFDPAAGQYVSVASSLTKIAAAGSLILVGGDFITANALEDSGTLSLTNNSTFSAATLHIDPGVRVTAGTDTQVTNNQGNGTANSITATSIVNQGLIVTSCLTGVDGADFRINATTLENDGVIAVGLNSSSASGSSTVNQAILQATTITGSGTIVLGAGQIVTTFYGSHTITTTDYPVLELSAAVSNNLLFSNNFGLVILDSPQSFTGTIERFTNGDSLSLTGISLSSVSGYSYAGTASGGVLSIQEGTTTIDLSFAGSFSTQSFSLSAGAQPLSSSLPSVVITDVGSSQALPYTAMEALALSQSGVVAGAITVTDSAADVLTS